MAGRAPDIADAPWKLGHAWYALGVMLFTGYAALYVYAVQYLEATLPWINRYVMSPVTDLTLAKIMIWSTM